MAKKGNRPRKSGNSWAVTERTECFIDFNLPKHNEIDTKNLYVGFAMLAKSAPL